MARFTAFVIIAVLSFLATCLTTLDASQSASNHELSRTKLADVISQAIKNAMDEKRRELEGEIIQDDDALERNVDKGKFKAGVNDVEEKKFNEVDGIVNDDDALGTTAKPMKAEYVCKFVAGDGAGGGENKISTSLKGQACIDKCVEEKDSDRSINGVTVRADGSGGCWCETGMTRVSRSSTYKTCFLNNKDALGTTAKPMKAVSNSPNSTNSPVSAVSLICHELSMNVTLDEDKLPGNLLNVTIVDCDPATYVVRRNTLSANFKDCAKNITESSDKITQENMVAVTNGVPVQSNVAHRILVYYYKLQCTFDRRISVATATVVRVRNKEEQYEKARTTNFAASMTVYQTKSYTRKAVAPFEVISFQPIYMQIIGVHNNTLFKFITEDCYATPTSNPNDRSSYLFFEDKCPIDKTFLEHASNSVNQFRFSIKAFTFIRLKKTVYFHCDLLVCKVGSNSDACTQKCTGLKQKRQAVADTGAVVDRVKVTSDAIHWNNKRSFDVQVEDVEKGMQLTILIPKQ